MTHALLCLFNLTTFTIRVDEADSSRITISSLTANNSKEKLFNSFPFIKATLSVAFWSQVPVCGLCKTTPHCRRLPHFCDLTTPQRFSTANVAKAQKGQDDFRRDDS